MINEENIKNNNTPSIPQIQQEINTVTENKITEQNEIKSSETNIEANIKKSEKITIIDPLSEKEKGKDKEQPDKDKTDKSDKMSKQIIKNLGQGSKQRQR